MQQLVQINSRPQDAYRRQDILTANSLDLIVMLYDALKKNIILGRKGITKQNALMAHKHLVKAQEIISELVNSLDMNYQIAEDLLSLYDFMLRNLEYANLHKDEETSQTLDPVIEIVDDLRSAWSEISESNKGSLYVSEGQA